MDETNRKRSTASTASPTSARSSTSATSAADAIDERIRRRFRACESLPLFPEPLPPGFFQPHDVGHQLRLDDLRPSAPDFPNPQSIDD